MVKNLFDYADTPLKEEKTNQQTQQNITKEVSEQNITEMYNKYKDLPQEQLVAEFIKSAKQQRSSGNLNDDKINTIYQTLSPYLNSQQKEFFNTLIDKIDE